MSEKQMIWELKSEDSPEYMIRCSYCKKVLPFYLADKFRMNAQKKNLDVWLIYKCSQCDSTKNVDVFTRVQPEQFTDNEYTLFMNNDKILCRKYAYDKKVIKRNQLVPNYSNISYTICGDYLESELLCKVEEEWLKVQVKFQYDFDIRLYKFFSLAFPLTRSEFEVAVLEGIFLFADGDMKRK